MFSHCTPLFFSLLAVNSPRRVILQGGTYAGKTFAILQILVTRMVQTPGLYVCVAGRTIPHLRRGAIRDLETIIDTPQLRAIFPPSGRNKTERSYTAINGSKIYFDSFDLDKAKGVKSDLLFVNEADGVPFEVFKQLDGRSKETWIDYNPTYKFWAHDLIGGEGNVFLRANYTHNDRVTPEKVAEIEGWRENDPMRWLVYGEGKTGQTEGQIFKFSIVEKMPEYAKCVGYGMDFGFARDPTTIIGVWQADGELYVQELLYGAGILVEPLAGYMRELGLHKVNAPIWGDGAAAATIGELVVRGFPVRSFKDKPTREESISVMQRFTLNVLAGSHNFIAELSGFCWRTNPVGISTAPTINDHCIDPYRYVGWSELRTPDGEPYKATSVHIAGKKRLPL